VELDNHDLGPRLFGPGASEWKIRPVGSFYGDKTIVLEGRRGIRTRTARIHLGRDILPPDELLAHIMSAIRPLEKQLARVRRETMFPFRPGRRRVRHRVLK
jgi:hypothetical protein